MDYNSLERIIEDNFDFIYDLTIPELNILAKQIRESGAKLLLIDILLPELIDTKSEFCLKLIYDTDKYEKETRHILSKKGLILSNDEIVNLVKKTKWGINYIIENADEIFKSITHYTVSRIFADVLKNHQDKIIDFKTISNLHVRFLFMEDIILEHEDDFPRIYENILDYLTSVSNNPNEQLTLTPELMSSKDISDLYYLLFKSKYRDMYCPALKEFILTNYSNNDLAINLIFDCSGNPDESIEEFKKDADILFKTSRNFKFFIYKNYSTMLSKEVLNDFKKYLKGFRESEEDYLEKIFINELGEKFMQYIDKYLSLSTNTDIRFVGAGTTCAAYKIGDYCLKLVKTKWSYEDVICPDLYLIAKNYEEDYIRNKDGAIAAGLEVQRYFSRSATEAPNIIPYLYRQALASLGYYTTDALINGVNGENSRLLDSYKQADCEDPELLPEWFKKYPMVLVDRDRVYKKESKHIKQLRSLMY